MPILRSLTLTALLLTVLFSGREQLSADTLHLIAVCDTSDDRIGPSVARDCTLIQNELRGIATTIDFDFDAHVLTEEQALPKNIKREISKLKVAPNDTIFFFFSGHGYHLTSEETQRWPHFFFTQSGQGLPMKDVAEALSAKKARLTLVFGDCCNNFIPDAFAPTDFNLKAMAFTQKSPVKQANYARLFRDSRGLILAVGAQEGDYASCNILGGFFTLSFFSAVDHSSNQKDENITWDSVMDLTQNSLTTIFDQVPDFQVDIK